MPNFDNLEQEAKKVAGEHGDVVNKQVDDAAKRAEGALGTDQGQPQGQPQAGDQSQQAAPQPDPSQPPPQQ